MPGKRAVERGETARGVEVTVGGKKVELNGFVEDVIQEVVVGLIRSLGTDDEQESIEVRIEASSR